MQCSPALKHRPKLVGALISKPSFWPWSWASVSTAHRPIESWMEPTLPRHRPKGCQPLSQPSPFLLHDEVILYKTQRRRKKKKTYCIPRLPRKENLGLKQWFSKPGTWWSSICITWALVRKASSLGPEPPNQKPWGWSLAVSGVTGPSGGSNTHPNLRTTGLIRGIVTPIRIAKFSTLGEG